MKKFIVIAFVFTLLLSCSRRTDSTMQVVPLEESSYAGLESVKAIPLDKNHPDTRAGYSVGYVAGHAADDRALRRLFSVADERMYAVKRAGKNHINGDPVPV